MRVALNPMTRVLLRADLHRDAGTRPLLGETAVRRQRRRQVQKPLSLQEARKDSSLTFGESVALLTP